jgi:ABC-type antimicrobial peptide transport system permease subunit
MHFHIRASNRATAATLLPIIRAELRAVDAGLPVVDLRTMQEFHDRGLVLWVIRTSGRVLMGLGGLALLLAALGVYGVKSYVVSQRTREIGIRIALGARPREIGMMLFRDGARTTSIGLAIGFPLALLLGRLLSVAIFEVSAFDPVALTVAPLVLIGAAALATYIPARRGMRVSPLDALRSE